MYIFVKNSTFVVCYLVILIFFKFSFNESTVTSQGFFRVCRTGIAVESLQGLFEESYNSILYSQRYKRLKMPLKGYAYQMNDQNAE